MLFSNLSIKMVFKGKKDTHLNSTTEDTPQISKWTRMMEGRTKTKQKSVN